MADRIETAQQAWKRIFGTKPSEREFMYFEVGFNAGRGRA